jgi:hypothetical protein
VRPKQAKRQANNAHAQKFRRRNRKLKREERRQRMERREAEWLRRAGIERDMSHPLVLGPGRAKRRKQ